MAAVKISLRIIYTEYTRLFSHYAIMFASPTGGGGTIGESANACKVLFGSVVRC